MVTAGFNIFIDVLKISISMATSMEFYFFGIKVTVIGLLVGFFILGLLFRHFFFHA